MLHSTVPDSSPIINHLLIKPEDRSCNTVKKSITLINTNSNHTVAEASPTEDPYSSIIKKNLATFNTECLNYIEKAQVKRAASIKKPYYSDDESSSDDDGVVEEVVGEAFGEQLNPEITEKCQKKILVKTDSQESSSSSDSVFKELPAEKVAKKAVVAKSPVRLKKKLNNDSELIMNHLCQEEKRQMAPFNPFSARQLNANVARNGMRLGLYK